MKDELYSERHADSSPRQVYAKLLDEGRYLCSVRTMYRILEKEDATQERQNQLRHPAYTKPELLATAANHVWSWDITKLRGPRKWTYYYLYVILDIYNQYVVGWMLAQCESAQLASRLIRESVEKQQVAEDQLTLHSDREPSMGSHSVAQLLATLGVTKSHSRPHVSNDNPFSESQFKTMKYCPEFPSRFDSFENALSFCRKFLGWYNDEHYHTGIGLLNPGHGPLRRSGPDSRFPQPSIARSLRASARAVCKSTSQETSRTERGLDQSAPASARKRASRDQVSPEARHAFDAPST